MAEIEGFEPAPLTDDEDSALDKLRSSPVGTNDPNVVGDVGPTDIPPGTDGDVDPSLVEDLGPSEPV